MKYALALLITMFSPLAFAATMGLDGLLSLIVTLVIGGLIFWLLWWFVGFIGLPEPFNKVAMVIIGLCALIFLLNVLLGLFGSHPFISLR